MKMYVLIADIN